MIAERLRFPGRILFLTEDLSLIKRQIEGEEIEWAPSLKLLENISTDEIAPARVCFYYDETLGDCVYTGLRGGIIKEGEVRKAGFSVVVSGRGKGYGSSREMAPYAERYSGISLVIAPSFEKIYLQNCENIGLLTATDFEIIRRIQNGEWIEKEYFLAGRSSITRTIIDIGGLFDFNRARMKGELEFGLPVSIKVRRPKTVTEKILLPRITLKNVREVFTAGTTVFVRPDLRFSHDYTTAMTDYLFRRNFGEHHLHEPESIIMYRDHLTYFDTVADSEKDAQMLDLARHLKERQEHVSSVNNIRYYGDCEAICHISILEEHALPGMIITGTDSHTCTAGAVGALAFGIGSTDMANAWFTGDVRVTVPESVKIILKGSLPAGSTSKDLVLALLAREEIKGGLLLGRVAEFSGEGLESLSVWDRSTVTNMSVEAGAFSGIFEVDAVTERFLCERRGLSLQKIRAMSEKSDADAFYRDVFEIDLSRIEPMVALPGDSHNGVPVSSLKEKVRVNIAYGGSCTGATEKDIDLYASVISVALKKGLSINPSVKFYIQFGSRNVKDYAAGKGYIELFKKAGVILLEPGCGACIGAGPGISRSKDEISISAINRNFPGRSGPGRVFLASPLTVAVSAIKGFITDPREF